MKVMLDPTRLNYKGTFGMENLQRTAASILDAWWVKLLVGLVVSVNDWFFHPNHETVEIVMALVLFDTLTGFMKAYNRSNVSSSGFFRFALKLGVYFMLLAVGSLLDKLVPFGEMLNCLSVVATFLAITESISVLENIAGLGFEVPQKLISMLKFAKGESDSAPAGKDEVKKTV